MRQAEPETNELLPSTPDALESGPAAETQGVTEPAPKKPMARKRKATTTTDDESAEPAKKKKKAVAPKKPAAKKKKTAKTPRIVVEDVASGQDVKAKPELERQASKPLAEAVKSKLQAVRAFLDTHTGPLIVRNDDDEKSNVATVDELDLLAALIILRVDYQLDFPGAGISLDDAGEMIVAWLGAGKVSVDFDKICDTEKAVQEKLANRGMGLEEVNFVEVEIEMLVAKRKKLAEDGEPAAGFRVYDEGEEEAGVDGASSEELV